MAHLAKPLWKIDRTPKTNTGHLGASYTEYTNRSGEKRGVITVTVRESLGKPVNRKFSVSKLGYDEALRQALEWRDSVLQEREKRESTGVEAPKSKPKAKAAPVVAPAKPKAKQVKQGKPVKQVKPVKQAKSVKTPPPAKPAAKAKTAKPKAKAPAAKPKAKAAGKGRGKK